MRKRTLGNSGLEIAPLMLGGNVLGWTADEGTSCKLLDRFVDAGLNAVDTADTYSMWVPGHKGGESETVIGSWLKTRGGRDKIVIAAAVGEDQQARCRSRHHLIFVLCAVCSLRGLFFAVLSLLPVGALWALLGVTLWAHEALIKQGKVRAIGVSNYSAPRLA